ncbi:hypothetical protein F2Q68_00041637, partial [Brassica cretica]
MPSKKKQPRTPSRLSNSEPPASPRTPSSSTASRDTYYINEEELRRGIEQASAAFPCLLGKSAIIGRVADVAPESIRGSKIWLSETSMVAASLIPGSTVSVSLACTESHSFPLSSIKAEYGVECESSIPDDEPGNYFVLATVLPSSKVSKIFLFYSSDLFSNMADVSSDSSDSASSCLTVSPSTSAARHVSVMADNFVNSGNSCSEQMLSREGEHALSVGYEDFEKAKIKIRPSAMREVILEVPKVNWEDVGGQKEVKNQLMEAVEWPQKHQDAFKRIGTRPPSGILMFGPPGCSKTLMARAVASEAGLNFLAVKGPELFSKWVGESEKAVRSLFAKARANAPSIIFFDEIDSLASIRGKENDGVSVSDRVMSQLLVELDGLHQRVGVTVIAATNRPDKIDSALLRPGRFDRLLYVGPPDEADREAILKIHLRKIPCSSDICLKELASVTKGYTGADISLICREAAIASLEESLEAEEISMRHLKAAISQVEPTDIQSYKALSEKFQRLVHTDPQRDNEEVEQPGNKNQRPSLPL